MRLWLLLFAAFIVQEPISTNTLLLAAYQSHYNVWLIHALFVFATLLDMVVGYAIGMFLYRRFRNHKVIAYVSRKAESFSKIAGKNGRRISLLIYGPALFPLSAVLAPLLLIPFWEATIFMFIGETVLWYGVEWLLVLGVKLFFVNPMYALYAIAIVSLLVSIGIRYIRRKSFNDAEE